MNQPLNERKDELKKEIEIADNITGRNFSPRRVCELKANLELLDEITPNLKQILLSFRKVLEIHSTIGNPQLKTKDVIDEFDIVLKQILGD